MVRLYDHPKHYDIAFSWDMAREVGFLRSLFRRHVRSPVKRILEPCCGTGRFMVQLPGYGFHVTGYDLSAPMLAYARRRIRSAGLQGRARVVRADMRTARFSPRFDAALNSINSFAYLLTDEDVLAHLRATADSLKPGGVYVIHMSCAHRRTPGPDSEGWVQERDGVSVHTFWSIDKQDRRRKLSLQTSRMRIRDHGQRFTLTSHHIQRLWLHGDWRAIIDVSGRFRLAAVYRDDYRHVPASTVITGEMGNHYYVLRAI